MIQEKLVPIVHLMAMNAIKLLIMDVMIGSHQMEIIQGIDVKTHLIAIKLIQTMIRMAKFII